MSTSESVSKDKGRGRRRAILLAAGISGILILVFLLLWLVSPVHVDEVVPATVRSDGDVFLRQAGSASLTRVRNLNAVRPGQTIVVREGSEAFLFLHGGVLSRIEGPAEVTLVESSRQIDAPSVLQGLLSQRAGVDPSGKSKVRTSATIELVSGTLTVKKGAARGNTSLRLRAANLYSRIENSSLRVSVTPQEGVVLDPIDGSPVVGFVSAGSDGLAAIVVPEALSGVRLSTQSTSAEKRSEDGYVKFESSMREMVDRVRAGEPGPRSSRGLDYEDVTDDSSGLSYLISSEVRQEGPRAEFSSEFFETPSEEELVAVPGLEVRLITEAELQQSLPSGVTIRLLPGNSGIVTVRGINYTVRASVVAGRLTFEGLPLGIDPAAYLGDMPAILSLETEEGAARVTYLPEETPPPPQEVAVARGVSEEGKALPHTNPYFSTIPTPLQVSLDWRVAATNLAFIALAALIIRVCVSSSINVMSANEDKLRKYLNPVLSIWRPLVDWVLSFLKRSPKLMGALLASPWLLLLLNGLLFAFLDVRFKPWAGAGLQVFPLMLLGFAAAFMVDPIVRVFVLKRWKVSHHFGFTPANLMLAIGSITLSRMLVLSPGLMLGGSGGLRASLQGLSASQKVRLTVIGLAATAMVGVLAWLLTLLLPLAASTPVTASIVGFLKGPFSTFQDILLLIFIASLTKIFFSLMPVPYSPGLAIASSNKIGWAVSFLVSGFLFFQLVLNKNTGMTKLLQERGALLIALVAVATLAAIALYTLSRISARKASVTKA